MTQQKSAPQLHLSAGWKGKACWGRCVAFAVVVAGPRCLAPTSQVVSYHEQVTPVGQGGGGVEEGRVHPSKHNGIKFKKWKKKNQNFICSVKYYNSYHGSDEYSKECALAIANLSPMFCWIVCFRIENVDFAVIIDYPVGKLQFWMTMLILML